jgi:hypothetical protein
MITIPSPQGAHCAMYADDMFDSKAMQLAPLIDKCCGNEWVLRGHLLAKNALVDGQKLQLGYAAMLDAASVARSGATPCITARPTS